MTLTTRDYCLARFLGPRKIVALNTSAFSYKRRKRTHSFDAGDGKRHYHNCNGKQTFVSRATSCTLVQESLCGWRR